MRLSTMIKISQKTHYEYKLDRKMIHNDFAEQYVNFLEDGYWFKDGFEIVPINQIKDEVPWNQGRLTSVMQAIDQNEPLPPIKLYYDEELKEYRISDGMHRYNASKKWNFTHIPAIVTRKVIGVPPDIKEHSRILEIQLHRQVQKEIVNELKKENKFQKLSPQWILKVNSNIATLEIDCYNPPIEETIKIKISFTSNAKVVNFESKFVKDKTKVFSMMMVRDFIEKSLHKVLEHYGRNI